MTRLSLWATLLRLVVFAAVMIALLVVVAQAIQRPVAGETTTLHAIFTDASGLKTADDVRMYGVPVGKVTRITLAGVVDEHVAFASPVGEFTHGSQIGEIELFDSNVTVDAVGDWFRLLHIAACHDYRAAFAGQHRGCLDADSTAGAGDDKRATTLNSRVKPVLRWRVILASGDRLDRSRFPVGDRGERDQDRRGQQRPVEPRVPQQHRPGERADQH